MDQTNFVCDLFELREWEGGKAKVDLKEMLIYTVEYVYLFLIFDSTPPNMYMSWRRWNVAVPIARAYIISYHPFDNSTLLPSLDGS